MSPTFESRLRDQLLEGLPVHRQQRRRRDRALVAVASAVVVVGAAIGVGAAGSDDPSSTERTDTRPAPTTSESSAPSTVDPTTTAASTPPHTTGTQVDPPGGAALDPALAGQADEVVRNLLAHLRAGDVDAALGLYQGYLGSGDARAELEDLIARRPDLVADPDPEIIVTPSFAWTDATPVVTVVSRAGPDPAVAAFLVSPASGTTPVLIQRLAETAESDPAPGTPVRPGETITLTDTFPTEGGTRAFIGDEEVAVITDPVDLTIGVVVPEDIGEEVVLTVSVATPELPGAVALWFPVA